VSDVVLTDMKEVYNAVALLLANDPQIGSLLGLDPSDSKFAVKRAGKIQKRRRPSTEVDSMPIISFYSYTGGYQPDNYRVYYAIFAFDVYTVGDIDLAQDIGKRLRQLFHRTIPVLGFGVTALESDVVRQYESEVNPVDSALVCWTTVIEVPVE